jgi:mannose-6-phosphate isomerase-like protein (cupin superfamily)
VVRPRRGAPAHRHVVENALAVRAGTAEAWVDQERASLRAGQPVILPAGRRHGFCNAGESTLHIEAILAAPTSRP